MLYILNALVPPLGGKGVMVITPSTLEEVKGIVGVAVSYIGHPETAKVLGLAPNRGEAKPQPGDVAYVLRLKFRPPVSGQEVKIGPEDLEVLRVEYHSL
ncbi:MAG: YddF family protein [Archaeoglobaceae archaeon]|nr:YddF family protein [Archaeoglobaceae archaeon]